MKNSNLDVWAIQYEPQELKTALSNIKVNGNIILYTNVLCGFKIGDVHILSRQFDTFLYSEENDLLVMLMRGGKTTSNDIRKYLESNNINYHEVIFAPSIKEYEDGDRIPELWIAREECVVEDALKDSAAKGKYECNYYPNIEGNLDLSYLTSSSNKIGIDGRIFKGLIQIEDKIILLVNQNDKRNVSTSNIFELLTKNKFIYRVVDGYPQIIENESKIAIK